MNSQWWLLASPNGKGISAVAKRPTHCASESEHMPTNVFTWCTQINDTQRNDIAIKTSFKSHTDTSFCPLPTSTRLRAQIFSNFFETARIWRWVLTFLRNEAEVLVLNFVLFVCGEQEQRISVFMIEILVNYKCKYAHSHRHACVCTYIQCAECLQTRLAMTKSTQKNFWSQQRKLRGLPSPLRFQFGVSIDNWASFLLSLRPPLSGKCARPWAPGVSAPDGPPAHRSSAAAGTCLALAPTAIHWPCCRIDAHYLIIISLFACFFADF